MRRSARSSARSDATPASLKLADEDVSEPTAYTPNCLSAAIEADTVAAPRFRYFPEEVLSCVCAALDEMKRTVTPAPLSDEDMIVQQTLLSVQRVSRTGWRAATPFKRGGSSVFPSTIHKTLSPSS